MTLKRKILISILFLTVLIILAISGTYYVLFNNQIKEHSHTQVMNAFEFILDDLHNRARNTISQTDRFMRSALIGPLYVLQLRQDQYAQREEEWGVREVRAMMPSISTITTEIYKFGELIEATDILIYDKRQQLLAFYRRQDEEIMTGGYLPQVFQEAFIPIQPEDDWFTTLRNMEEIPQQAMPEGIALTYQGEPPSSTTTHLSQHGNTLFLTVLAPIFQKDELGGICVLHLALNQKDMERYARLSGTQVNLFAGSTFSVGTLPAYTILPDISPEARVPLDIMNLTEEQRQPMIRFSESEIAGQGYYIGLLALGDAQKQLGVITVHFPRELEAENRNSFILAVVVIIVVFGLLAIGGASFLSVIIVRPIKRLTSLLHQLTEGDLEGIGHQLSLLTGTSALRSKPAPQHSKRSVNDEFVLLFRSFHAMIDYLLDMVSVAEHIAQGEIAQEVTPRSEKDRLGNAFARMTHYLKTIASVATAVADGDLRQDIQPQTDNDVLGQAFHKLHALRTTMSKIMQEASTLKEMSQVLQHISYQMVNGAQQSSQRTQEVSSISQQLNQNVSEVSIATSQMAASIQEISHTAHDVADVVDTAVATASSTTSTITDLEVRSQEVGNIIKLITSITQQTNILALNATIEAARAGDMGRGFAVVANEVKDLAREITKSAENITAQIEAIQASSRNATEAINQMGDDIERIHTATSVIVAAVTEQASTTNVITQNLSDAANRTQEVTQAIDDVANVAQNSSELAQKVQESAEKQASLAEQLQQLISKFNI